MGSRLIGLIAVALGLSAVLTALFGVDSWGGGVYFVGVLFGLLLGAAAAVWGVYRMLSEPPARGEQPYRLAKLAFAVWCVVAGAYAVAAFVVPGVWGMTPRSLFISAGVSLLAIALLVITTEVEEVTELPDPGDPDFRLRIRDERRVALERRITSIEKMQSEADAPLAAVLATTGQSLGDYVAETSARLEEFEAAAESGSDRAAAADLRMRMDAVDSE